MKQLATRGIVLRRTDYQEADRIISLLTPDHGKLTLMAKGVRRSRSKLAGGIELFSVSDITFIASRSSIKTLVSARLDMHFRHIVTDITRTMFGYELIKIINKVTEDAAGPEYYDLLLNSLRGLDDSAQPLPLIELWFGVQMLDVTGHMPDLRLDRAGEPLSASEQYVFDFDAMGFEQSSEGVFGARHIKLLRLMLAFKAPTGLDHIADSQALADECLVLIRQLLRLSLNL